MTYRVTLTENAKVNLRNYYLRAAEAAPQTAAAWLDRFEQALATLSTQPERWPLAPEDDMVDAEIRQLLFGRRSSAYRALFAVAHEEVLVLHVRRAAMDTATEKELYG